MTSSFRRLILATLGTVALLVLSGAGSGVAAAGGLPSSDATFAIAPSGPNPGGNNPGGNNQGGNNQGGSGQGTKTPELPGGVLFAIGLIPLGGALFLARARRSRARA